MPDENGNPTPEEVQALQARLAELEQQNAAQSLALWRNRAIEEHPNLKAFADLITGDSEEAVLASAKGLAERFGQAFPTPTPPATPDQQPSPQQLYGDPGAGGSGVPIQQPDPLLDLENRVRSNMPRGMSPENGGSNHGRGTAKVSKRDAEQFVQLAASRHVRDALISHGKMRPARGERWRHTENGTFGVG